MVKVSAKNMRESIEAAKNLGANSKFVEAVEFPDLVEGNYWYYNNKEFERFETEYFFCKLFAEDIDKDGLPKLIVIEKTEEVEKVEPIRFTDRPRRRSRIW